MKTNITKALTGLTLVMLMAVAYVPTASADCSYNGYINSKGKCAKSFKENKYKEKRDHDHDYDREEYKVQSLQAYIEQLIKLLERLKELQVEQSDSENVEFDVRSRSAIEIDEDSAILRGQVYRDSDEEVTVYFEYSRGNDDLDKETAHIDLDEDDNDTFSRRLINLHEDSVYYYRAVAVNEDGEKECGSTMSFRTDEEVSSNDEEPDVDTDDAADITDQSAELNGSVDMNDYNNGLVFFAYGEDEDLVKDVKDEDRFTDVDEAGDDLQLIVVDDELDGTADYSKDVDNLDPDRDHFFTLCVEFEDSDGRDNILCGSVKQFTTDD